LERHDASHRTDLDRRPPDPRSGGGPGPAVATASACNEYNHQQRIAAVAPDGATLEVIAGDSGAGRHDEVAVVGADGRERARCKLIDGEEDRRGR
jgi:hypothetical protein